MTSTTSDLRASADARPRYEVIAATLEAQIASGAYEAGQRLPSERDLAESFGVSRPTVRRALIVLEMRGLVETRQGAGVFMRPAAREPTPGPAKDSDISAFEQAEARRMFEGETAALAATLITDEELAELEATLADMAAEGATKEQSELADRQFHILIAQATRNPAIVLTIEGLWDLRYNSSLCMRMLDQARNVRQRPLVDEHREIIESLRTRDPRTARAAMHAHLNGLVENLLTTAELEAMKATRERLAARREEVAKRTAVSTPL